MKIFGLTLLWVLAPLVAWITLAVGPAIRYFRRQCAQELTISL